MKPVNIGKVTFPYGVSYSDKRKGVHKGVDYGVPVGTPVFAAVGGKVIHVGPQGAGGFKNRGWGTSFGVHILVENENFPDGTPGLYSGYMHLSRTKVKLGEHVKKGDFIGYSGNTGATTGPHLHFQVLKTRFWNLLKPAHVDPQKWIDA